MIKIGSSFIVLAVLVILVLPSSICLVFAQEVSEEISAAKRQIAVCYEAAAEAELAGANVSSLALALNDAGVLLSEAELAYSRADFSTASNLAVQCRESLNHFVDKAADLKASVELERSTNFLTTVVYSTLGTVVVVVVGFRVLVFLKKRYGQVE